MNLYLVCQKLEWTGYDTFDSMIVAAESEDEARLIHPYGDYQWNGADWIKDELITTLEGTSRTFTSSGLSEWANPDDIIVELIGITDKPGGVILASFNAG